MGQPVYLVRHGQSEWNVLRLTQGQTTHPALTPLGRQQALSAGVTIASDLELHGSRAARLVASDLVRAVETAEIIGAQIGLGPELDARLREQHLGALQGRSYEDTWSVAEQHDWSDPYRPLAGGESVMQVRDRLAAVLREIDQSRPTVLVSHGDAIRIAIADLTGSPPNDAPWVDVPNGAVFRYDRQLTRLQGCPMPLEPGCR